MTKTKSLVLIAWIAITLPYPVMAQVYESLGSLDSQATWDLKLSEGELEGSQSGINSGGIYAGYSFSFTKFHSKGSFEVSETDFVSGSQTLIPLENDFELTPRIWLGARHANGIGFRTSFWNYDESGIGYDKVTPFGRSMTAVTGPVNFPASITTGTAGDRLTVSSAIKASTLDFEGTYDTRIGSMQTIFGAGIRFAESIMQNLSSITPGALGGNNSAMDWSRRFKGFGPMLTANGRLPLGNSGFYGLGGATLSILFGQGRLNRNQSINFPTLPPFSTINSLNLEGDEISGIYGVQMGLGHRRPTRFGTVYVEATYEGQLWTDLGSPNLSFSGFNSLSANLGFER